MTEDIKDPLPDEGNITHPSLRILIEDQMMPDVLVLEEGGKSFKFEYAMERISLHPTQFKDIWPEYE